MNNKPYRYIKQYDKEHSRLKYTRAMTHLNGNIISFVSLTLTKNYLNLLEKWA
jgi:hypothetical protein